MHLHGIKELSRSRWDRWIESTTITDVAEEAGVSVSTVSRHLRGDRVPRGGRIDRAVARLRYGPARLRSRSSRARPAPSHSWYRTLPTRSSRRWSVERRASRHREDTRSSWPTPTKATPGDGGG